MMYHGFRIAVFAAIFFFGALQSAGAEEGDSAALAQMVNTKRGNSDPQTQAAGMEKSDASGILGLHFSGFWSMEFGQMVNAYMLSNFAPHEDVLHTYLNFGITKQISEGLQINAGAELKMYYNSFNQTERAGVESFFLPAMYYSIYIDRANAIYSLGDPKSPFLQFTLGYFPFKYNPDSRDLGEYLYRSGTYPAYLIADFDYAQARLAGLKISSDLFGWLHQDLLLTTSTDRLPFYDLNLGYIITVDMAKVLNIGIGGMYQSLVPANDNLTTPRTAENMYFKNPVLQPDGSYTGDTSYYTSAGLKLMARFTFDPKRIFLPSESDLGIFGIEDLKLYGEIAILGVENYPSSIGTPNNYNPYGYDTLLHKMPITLGLNLPTFKVLDVLTGEVEWYGCTYPSGYEYKDQAQYLPTPLPQNQVYLDAHDYASLDNWKWSIYAKKSFKNGLYMVGQIACDHVRNETPVLSFVDLEEALRTDRSWWWVFKLGYQF
jgi:hypothetical protein